MDLGGNEGRGSYCGRWGGMAGEPILASLFLLLPTRLSRIIASVFEGRLDGCRKD
jgi:hypothetical protein